MMKQRTAILFLSMLTLIGLTNCVPVVPGDALPTITAPAPAETPALTPTAEILADCFPSATVFAWQDNNGNGIQDEGEMPLPGMQFTLNPVAQNGQAASDEDGFARISAWAPGECLPMQITAVSHPDYTLSTPQTIDYVSADTTYAFGFQPLPTSTLVETEMYTGAIFSAKATAEFISWLDEPVDSFWTPTAKDVAGFEAGLASFLETTDISYRDTQPIVERLPEYTRQYFGLVQGDAQLIFGNFFCESWEMDWGETAVIVMDGGDCYFQVIFDVDSETYTSLSINGEA